ncbi:alpha/beta-hydrolase [Dacryopinax primogenitus]|uniref:Alpha/beta-hydrolase n=1 Tax=Dacryopinax primogenitus (strain DJM 731) TaxID=1858805 RepID=M5FP74_DACPD|nr:alpha/beta-hydrolase [Dacryopinax primogenitus]EJT96863.1 alpha/beta-hydrolase [Dacryopinax primogenitus]
MASLYDEDWVLGHDKIRFYTRTYEPPQGVSEAKAAILFLHGYVEHIARYEHVFPVWAEQGLAVYTYDQRGFGRTGEGDGTNKGTGQTRTSTEDQMEDLEWFIRRTAEWVPGKKLFLVGHSMGGFNVLNFLCSPQSRSATLPKISGVVGLSPLLELTHPPSKLLRTILTPLSFLLPNITVSVAVRSEWISRDPNVVKSYNEDPLVHKRGTIRSLRSMLDAVDALRLREFHSFPVNIPVLLLHGTADEVNSQPATLAWLTKLRAKNKTFTPYEGGFHELMQEPHPIKETVMQEVATWVLHVSAQARPASMADSAKARL